MEHLPVMQISHEPARASDLKLVMLLVLAAALLLCGCSKPDLIIMDKNGKPVAGAMVVGTSFSIGGQTTYSDSKGHAKIPWAVQETKWISVSKEGFSSVQNIDVAQKKPIVITLVSTNH